MKKCVFLFLLVAVLFGSLPLNGSAYDENAQIHYWTFDADAEDVAKNTCYLVDPDASASFVEGVVGKALDVSQSDHLYTETIGEPYLSFTVAAWFQVAQIPEGYAVLFSRGSKAEGHFELYLHGDRLCAYLPDLDGMPDLGFGDANSETQITAAAGTWQHAAMTFDGSDFVLYYNGKAVLRADGAGTMEEPLDDYYNYFSIGALFDSSLAFPGYLDEIIVSNCAFSAEEIARLAEAPAEAAEEWKTAAGAADKSTPTLEPTKTPEGGTPTASPTKTNTPERTPASSASVPKGNGNHTTMWIILIVVVFVCLAGVVLFLILRKKK